MSIEAVELLLAIQSSPAVPGGMYQLVSNCGADMFGDKSYAYFIATKGRELCHNSLYNQSKAFQCMVRHMSATLYGNERYRVLGQLYSPYHFQRSNSCFN